MEGTLAGIVGSLVMTGVGAALGCVTTTTGSNVKLVQTMVVECVSRTPLPPHNNINISDIDNITHFTTIPLPPITTSPLPPLPPPHHHYQRPS